MRSSNLMFLAAALLPAAFASADSIVNFEDKPLAANSFYNGGPTDNAAGFDSGGSQFTNTFTDYGGGYSGWYGFAYSNVNDPATPGYDNQHAAYTGTGFGGSGNYGLGFDIGTITLPAGERPMSVRVTNTTYAALAVRHGYFSTTPFGGASGNDPDFFSVTFTGRDAANDVTGAVTFFLADYRFDDDQFDYIVNDWRLVDLSPLGDARSLGISFASSQNDPDFGSNVPSYLALDNLVTVPEPASIALVAIGLSMLFTRSRKRQEM